MSPRNHCARNHTDSASADWLRMLSMNCRWVTEMAHSQQERTDLVKLLEVRLFVPSMWVLPHVPACSWPRLPVEQPCTMHRMSSTNLRELRRDPQQDGGEPQAEAQQVLGTVHAVVQVSLNEGVGAWLALCGHSLRLLGS